MQKILLLIILCFFTSFVFADTVKESDRVEQGIALFSKGRYQNAIRFFERALSENPDREDAYVWLGKSYMKLGDHALMTNPEMLNEAENAFQKALSLNPESSESYYHLGVIYLLLFNKHEALLQYEKLKNIDRDRAALLFNDIERYREPRAYRSVGIKTDESENSQTEVTIVGNQVFVPVTIRRGYTTVQATLLLDTGATHTTISLDLANKLHLDLEHADKGYAMVVGGGLVKAMRAKIDYITVGPHEQKDILVNIIDTVGMPRPADGLLGMNVLRKFKYQVDFKNQVIEWYL